MPKKSWLHFIPFYVYFTKAPTLADLAFTDLRVAQNKLFDAELSVVEAKAEVVKRETIYTYVTATQALSA